MLGHAVVAAATAVTLAIPLIMIMKSSAEGFVLALPCGILCDCVLVVVMTGCDCAGVSRPSSSMSHAVTCPVFP
jgi:hypothetical protein